VYSALSGFEHLSMIPYCASDCQPDSQENLPAVSEKTNLGVAKFYEVCYSY